MTAVVSMLPDITRAVGVPRTLIVPFGLGCPFGAPRSRALQTRVLQALLELCAGGKREETFEPTPETAPPAAQPPPAND